MKVSAGMSLVALLGLAAVAFAGPVGVQRQPVENRAALAQLQSARAQLAEKALNPTVKGPLRFCYMNQQERIDNLIDRLQSGQRVSRGEISRALGSC
jgi:hypothetical protein